MLKQMRERAGISQSALADKTEISKRSIQHYEQGSRNLDHARLETLCTFAMALNCKVGDLLADDELKKIYKKVR